MAKASRETALGTSAAKATAAAARRRPAPHPPAGGTGGAAVQATCDRHVTAESLHDEVSGAGVKVSLATVYNTLHQFTQAGLLRQVIVDAARSYFDTNTGDHQHFFLEDEGMLIDIAEHIAVSGVPTPPAGMAVDRVDVVVRVKRQSNLLRVILTV